MKEYFSLIKFSHTVFALPFALIGFTLGILETGEGLNTILLALVLLCMVFARSAAMAFNRYLDRDIDAVNPRTLVREIPAGKISPGSALLFVVLNCVAFVVTTYFINSLCFYLSPVALAVVLGYSYTKRFTWLCHVVLGAGLGLAPVGAYLAVTGHFAVTPVIYGLAILCWVSGFDVIYALQDEEFDRSQQLYSMPAFFGKKQALRISEWLHLFSSLFIVLAARQILGAFPQTGWLLWLATAFFMTMLVWQHRIVKPDDLSRVNMAFFTTNGIASVVYGLLVIGDLIY